MAYLIWFLTLILTRKVGSIEVGKLADLVLWTPEFFGTKPETLLKGGYIVRAMMGDANASIPTPQPVISRPMFGSYHSTFAKSCVTFVSKESISSGTVQGYGLVKRVEAVKGCRDIGKKDMVLNSLLPSITVDPETYEVHVDGDLIQVAPASRVCMGQDFYLF
jgi:urease alpha subunit